MIGLLARVLEQGSSEEQEPTVDPDPYTGDDVVTAFVERLRRDEVTAGQRATIREELGIETPESVEVRLDHVQSQVVELSAYTDALSEFLDDEGRRRTPTPCRSFSTTRDVRRHTSTRSGRTSTARTHGSTRSNGDCPTPGASERRWPRNSTSCAPSGRRTTESSGLACRASKREETSLGVKSRRSACGRNVAVARPVVERDSKPFRGRRALVRRLESG